MLCTVQPTLYNFKFKVYRILELLIVLTAFRSVYHINKRFKIPLFRIIHRKDKSDICRVQELFGFYPKVIAGRLLRGRSVFYQDLDEFQNVFFTVLFADVRKRVVVHRLCKINGVEHLDLIRLINNLSLAVLVHCIQHLAVFAARWAAPCKHFSALDQNRSLRIGNYIGGVHLHQVRLHEKARFT